MEFPVAVVIGEREHVKHGFVCGILAAFDHQRDYQSDPAADPEFVEQGSRMRSNRLGGDSQFTSHVFFGAFGAQTECDLALTTTQAEPGTESPPLPMGEQVGGPFALKGNTRARCQIHKLHAKTPASSSRTRPLPPSLAIKPKKTNGNVEKTLCSVTLWL